MDRKPRWDARSAGMADTPGASSNSLTVAVMDQPGRRALARDRHSEGFDCNRTMQCLTHAPAHDLAGMHVDQGGEEQPAFPGPDIGQIGKPDPCRDSRRKGSAQSVRCDQVVMRAVSRSHPPRDCSQAPYASQTHQAGDAVASCTTAGDAEPYADARGAVAPAALGMKPANVGREGPVLDTAPAFWPFAPCVTSVA